MKKLLYEDKIPVSYRKQFVEKVVSIAKYLEIEPDWLMLVMNSESGLDSKAVNFGCKKSGGSASTCAVGLIQFMPKTSKGKLLNTTNTALYNMTAVQQLDYVKKYYSPFKNKITSFYDLYLATFYPVAMGKPKSYIIGSERGLDYAKKVASQNQIIDVDKNGLIDMKDWKKYIDGKIAKSNLNKKEVDTSILIKKKLLDKWVGISFVVLGVGGCYFAYKNKESFIREAKKLSNLIQKVKIN